MKKTHTFIENGDRYRFDFGQCSSANGFAQFDTENDAWYFGQWSNPFTLTHVSYVEGDLTIAQADTPEEFAEYLKELIAFYDEHCGFLQLDCGLRDNREAMIEAFTSLGLGQYTA